MLRRTALGLSLVSLLLLLPAQGIAETTLNEALVVNSQAGMYDCFGVTGFNGYGCLLAVETDAGLQMQYIKDKRLVEAHEIYTTVDPNGKVIPYFDPMYPQRKGIRVQGEIPGVGTVDFYLWGGDTTAGVNACCGLVYNLKTHDTDISKRLHWNVIRGGSIGPDQIPNGKGMIWWDDVAVSGYTLHNPSSKLIW